MKKQRTENSTILLLNLFWITWFYYYSFFLCNILQKRTNHWNETSFKPNAKQFIYKMKCSIFFSSAMQVLETSYLMYFDRLWFHGAFLRNFSYMFSFEMQSRPSDTQKSGLYLYQLIFALIKRDSETLNPYVHNIPSVWI